MRPKQTAALVMGILGIILLIAAFTQPFMFVESVVPYAKQCGGTTGINCDSAKLLCNAQRTQYVANNKNYECGQCVINCGAGMSLERQTQNKCEVVSGGGALVEAMFTCSVKYDESIPTKTVCVKGSYWSNFLEGDYRDYDVYHATENDKLLSKKSDCSYACRQVDDRNAKCISQPAEAEVLDYEHRCIQVASRFEVWQVSSLNRLISRLDICTDNEACVNGACTKVLDIVTEDDTSFIQGNASQDLAICAAGQTAPYLCADGTLGMMQCVDGLYDEETAECQVSTCLNFQVMDDAGECVLKPENLLTEKGAADFWSQYSSYISVFAGLALIGAAYLIRR